MRNLREEYLKNPTAGSGRRYLALAVDLLMPVRRTSDWSQAFIRTGKRPTAKEAFKPPRGRALTDEDLKQGKNFICVPTDTNKPVQLIFGNFKTVGKPGVFQQTLEEGKVLYFDLRKQMLSALDPARLSADLREYVTRFGLTDGDALFPGKDPRKPSGFTTSYRRALVNGGVSQGGILSHGDTRGGAVAGRALL